MEPLHTIESTLAMTAPADDFFVNIEDNVFGIRFKGYKLRNVDTNETYHEFSTNDVYELDYFADHLLEYTFPQKILRSKTLGSSITLVVGEQMVHKLTLIERHYIGDKLMASYRSDYPLFMPNSENNVEFIYSVPALSEETQKKLDEGLPVEAKSDTFIFVNGKMVIHRRATYQYVE